MIDHIKLMVVLANLLLGIGIAMYVQHLYRRVSFPPLKPVFFQVLFNNLLVFLLLTTKYYDVNIGTEIFKIPDTVDSVITAFLIYLFFIGFSYASLWAYLAFLEKSISHTVQRYIGVATILLIAGVFLEPFFTKDSLPANIHYHIYENAGAIFLLLELVIMIVLPIKAGKLKNRALVKVIRAFSYLYIMRFPVGILLMVIPQPFRLAGALLLLNAVPYIWCRYFMLPYVEKAKSKAPTNLDIPGFAKHYSLSPRETEIFGLIMEGKSNRDMEESLFISYHTVKNHVYNIYRKLGVKTRFELLHLISNSGK